jgi:hypothetical protein
VGGMVSLLSVSLENITHTCVEGCIRGGAPWYAPNKDGFLKIFWTHIYEWICIGTGTDKR